ncbi:hypothetical protein EKH83_09500 [Arcticibacter tournemirensis]|uniref:PD-(D/E)XK nuclease family transposase n=1 Tax=Arcticibacter tournemirensis TaxID=699437 RepID=A0A4Q0MB97_9SPHI|nr:hypothetical protein EKH83_09500 [Arcticibacter tournemirensis]
MELVNFTKEAEELETDLEKWVYMLKNMSRLEQIPAYLNKRVFQKIFQIAEINNLTPEDRAMYEASLKEKLSDSGLLRAFKNRQFEKWDYENVLATAMRESKLEGKQEGAEQKSYEVVERLLLKLGLPDDQIADLANVTIEFVRKVRSELAKKKR